MQTGFIFEGTKKKLLSALSLLASEEKDRFKSTALGNQVCIGYKKENVNGIDKEIPLHEARPLAYTAQAALIDKGVDAIKEQVSHCQDDDHVQVMFNLTVHRPDPK